MSNFDPDPRPFFDAIYQGQVPWDIGAPQPDLCALFDDLPPEAPTLDLGCGTGDHVFELARRGLPVLGIDFVESPIIRARSRAASLPPEQSRLVEFIVADALHLSELGRQFGAIVDSGFLHLFGQEERDRFAEELAAALVPGGRYYLLAFAIEFDLPNTPRKVTEEELRARFAPDKEWRVLALRPAHFLNQFAATPALAACIERSRTPAQ